ncbi:MAG: hypothetical protein JXA11_12820 [Phycisphaerae bacterium]|nr:hypothetical protein [Phycisphaerae bacterium]
MRFQRIIPLVALTAVCGSVFADAKPQPAKTVKPQAPKEEILQAEVVSVSGGVHRYVPEARKGKWVPLKAGEILGELAVIRMGLNGKLVLQFSDRVNLTAAGGGKFGIRTLRKRGEVVHANVGLKYGSLRLKVDSTVGKNDFRVTTPVATLSARGCNCFVSYFPDQGLNFANTHDTWAVATNRGSKTTHQGDKTNQNLDSTGEIVSKELDTHQSDPLALGNVEDANLRKYGTGRGVMDFGGTGAGGINTGGLVKPIESCPRPSPCPKGSSHGEYNSSGP